MKKYIVGFILILPFMALAGFDTLYIPTDSKAKYTVIQNKKVGELTILQTIRKSPYGVSFSTRLFNCSNATFKYLVDVEGEKNINVFLEKNNEAMKFLNESNMTTLVRGSISHYAYKYACK